MVPISLIAITVTWSVALFALLVRLLVTMDQLRITITSDIGQVVNTLVERRAKIGKDV